MHCYIDQDVSDSLVVLLMGIVFYIASVQQRWRHLRTENRLRKWYRNILLAPAVAFVLGILLFLLLLSIRCALASRSDSFILIPKAYFAICFASSELMAVYMLSKGSYRGQIPGHCSLCASLGWVAFCIVRHKYDAAWAFQGGIHLGIAIAAWYRVFIAKGVVFDICLALLQALVYTCTISVSFAVGAISFLMEPWLCQCVVLCSITMFILCCNLFTREWEYRQESLKKRERREDARRPRSAV